MAVDPKVKEDLKAFIDRMRGFLDDAERGLRSASCDEDAIQTVLHDSLWGLANASMSLGDVFIHMKFEREKREYEEAKAAAGEESTDAL